MTDRRAFLSLLTAAAAGLVLDPERLLWVPGRKTIFLPTPATHSWFITPQWIETDMAEFWMKQDAYRYLPFVVPEFTIPDRFLVSDAHLS